MTAQAVEVYVVIYIMTPSDRITSLHVAGLRTLADIHLRLDGLTILIGPSSSGKSSIIEAVEILRRAPGTEFLKEFNRLHGGFPSLLRHGAQTLTLGVRIEGTGLPVEYKLTLGSEDSAVVVVAECLTYRLDDKPESAWVLHRENDSLLLGQHRIAVPIQKQHLALSNFDSIAKVDAAEYLAQASDDPSMANLYIPSGPVTLYLAPHIVNASRAFARVRNALGRIRVHLPFEVTAAWLARSQRRSSVLRESIMLEPAEDLDPLAANLANAFATLKNNYGEDHWQETLDYVRAGLGEDVETVATRADPSGGSIGLRLKYRGVDAYVPAQSLSDGTLAYLAFVALYRLDAVRSLLCFDEPEQYLHPDLLGRVLGMLQALSEEHPVLVATHSDRLLDALPDPGRSVVLCELGEGRTTRLLRPDPVALNRWLSDYRGLGELRGAGHEDLIMTRPET